MTMFESSGERVHRSDIWAGFAFDSIHEVDHPHLVAQTRDGIPGLVDISARDLFGVDSWFALKQSTREAARRTLEDGGQPAQSFDRWISEGWQLERNRGHRMLASHQYRIGDGFVDPKGNKRNFLVPDCWMRENGDPATYLTSYSDVVLVRCRAHGPCAIPVRTLMQLGSRCWTCLQEDNSGRKSKFLNVDNSRLSSQFSELNLGLRPDMFRATSQFDIIWECPVCANRWCIPVFLRSRNNRSNCPSCQSNTSKSEITLWLALKQLLPGIEVRHGEGVTGYSASDVTIPGHRIIVEYDGDLHAKKGDSELRKDRATYHLGWKTIRLRMVGLPPVLHQKVRSMDTPRSGKIHATLPNLLRVLIEWGVPVPPESLEADHFALTQGLQDEASSLLERMSHRRKNTGRKRSA